MHIQKINIRSILGIDDLEITPGNFTTIEGPNGTGKTSILEAIKAAVSSGHDATLLRNGAEKGEVVFVLDDGMSITKAVTADGSSTVVRDAAGKKVARPAEAIASLLDMISVNPVDFLTAKKKDRVKVLLESMPMDVDTARLSELAGIEVTAAPGVHALQVIELTATKVYDERTGTNRAIKEKDGTIKQLREAMPPAPAGIEGTEDEITDQVTEATTARDTRLAQIATKLTGIENDTRTKIASSEAEARTKIDGIRTKLQTDIDALKATAQLEVDAINTDLSASTATLNAELAKQSGLAATARENANAKHTTTTAPLAAALTAIRTNREAAAKRDTTTKLIETMDGELEELRADAERQTNALAALESYKSELLDSLPIPGLEVRDGEIYRNDVVFDRLNTAQQVDIAVEIAKLRAGKLSVCCVDGLELLDSKTFESFRDRATEAGLQMFVTRVGDTDSDSFEITTTN